MAVVNFAHREITTKIVYFGAAGAGTNTNVVRLHQQLLDRESTPGSLHQFGPRTTVERTACFDLRPSEATIPGFSIRYRVYSMPGGLDDLDHRNAVMREVDAVVLVVDGRPDAHAGNEAALLELEELVTAQGLDLGSLAVLIQVNHLDHEGADAEAAVKALNPFGFPVVGATAKQGAGVHETFQAIAALTLKRVEDNLHGGNGSMALTAMHVQHPADLPDGMHADAPPESIPTETGNAGPSTPAPASQVEVAFQPTEFAGSHPVRVVGANIDGGQVYVDVELQRMGGGELRQLRVKLANRPTDVPAASRPPQASMVSNPTPSVMGVTDNLPDKFDFEAMPASVAADSDDLPAVTYGIVGVLGGLLAGLLTGFLLFT